MDRPIGVTILAALAVLLAVLNAIATLRFLWLKQIRLEHL